MTMIKSIAPAEIEDESFRIIEREFQEQTGMNRAELKPGFFQIIRQTEKICLRDYHFFRMKAFIRQDLQHLTENGLLIWVS